MKSRIFVAMAGEILPRDATRHKQLIDQIVMRDPGQRRRWRQGWPGLIVQR